MKILLPMFLMFFSLVALAENTVNAPGFVDSLFALWKAIQDHASTALILVPLFQLLRTNEVLGILKNLSGRWMQVSVAVITTLGFVVDAAAKGQSWGQAAIAGLFTAGGAMLIYDAIRSINPKS